MAVRPLEDEDRPAWLAMRAALWPDSDAADPAGADAWVARADAITIVAQPSGSSGGQLIGFAEAGERPYADGSDTSPVAFLEGWYVEPEYRCQGFGRELVQAVETWARSRGLTELASDSLLENTNAHAAHEAAGFREVERAVRYRKPLF